MIGTNPFFDTGIKKSSKPLCLKDLTIVQRDVTQMVTDVNCYLQALREYLAKSAKPLDEMLIRQVIREELDRVAHHF